MHLFIYSENPEISDMYQEHSTYHPGDCGFDLFVPEDVVFEPGEKSKIIDLVLFYNEKDILERRLS